MTRSPRSVSGVMASPKSAAQPAMYQQSLTYMPPPLADHGVVVVKSSDVLGYVDRLFIAKFRGRGHAVEPASTHASPLGAETRSRAPTAPERNGGRAQAVVVLARSALNGNAFPPPA